VEGIAAFTAADERARSGRRAGDAAAAEHARRVIARTWAACTISLAISSLPKRTLGACSRWARRRRPSSGDARAQYHRRVACGIAAGLPRRVPISSVHACLPSARALTRTRRSTTPTWPGPTWTLATTRRPRPAMKRALALPPARRSHRRGGCDAV
jgi:hypothetical protein